MADQLIDGRHPEIYQPSLKVPKLPQTLKISALASQVNPGNQGDFPSTGGEGGRILKPMAALPRLLTFGILSVPVSGGVASLLAQAPEAPQATLQGRVLNEETVGPVAGAIVAVAGLNRATATGNAGRYLLRQIPAGLQQITVRSLGYASRTLYALVPREGELEINISLRPSPFPLPPIEVRPRAADGVADGEDPAGSPDRWISIGTVRNHPLLSEPDVFQVLGGGAVVIQPESPSGVHIRGGDSDQTAFLLDGIPVFNPYHTAGVFSAWNPDAIARVRVSPNPPPQVQSGLSGSVEAGTRDPGSRFTAQGGVSTTQARLTVDGPLGAAGIGYLVSVRSGFPGFVAPKGERSYLRGGTNDWIVKLALPAGGGIVRLLAYDNRNGINTAVAGDTLSEDPSRNSFAWHSRSFGGQWQRDLSAGAVRVQAWSARSDAGSAWAAESGPVEMAAARRDLGVLATLENRSAGGATLLGLRAEWSRTAYRIALASGAAPFLNLEARTPVMAAFAERATSLGRRVDLGLSASVTAAAGDLRVAPRARLQWRPVEQLLFAGSYARSYQYAQSLRNPESVVGTVFPVDLYLGAGTPGVPVARSDQAGVEADYRPAPGVRLRAQAYARGFRGLLLVAPRDGGPFTTGDFVVGSGTSRGASIDAAWSMARLSLVASYGLQRVRRAHADTSYAPDYGTTQLFEGGINLFPAASFSVRLGATGAVGRRATLVSGALVSESCNLVDRGCEFGGSPSHTGQMLGGMPLPSYFRIDLGVRKQWGVKLGGSSADLALFGTVTNVFNHRNVLTYSGDLTGGPLSLVELRPRAPLVVGLDWRF